MTLEIADIMTNDRFVYREDRGPAWHRMGTPIETGRKLTASEGIKEAKIDFKVAKFPLYVKTAGGMKRLDTDLDANTFAILREPVAGDPQYRYFGECSRGYTIMSAERLAQIIDPLTQAWPVETVGALGHGETIFVTLFLGGYEVAGVDPVEEYFMVSDSRDAKSGALKATYSPVRTVCRNTFRLALAAATASVSIPHDAVADISLAFHTETMRSMKAAQMAMRGKYELLADTVVGVPEAASIFAAAYPMPSVPKSKLAMVDAVSSGTLADMVGLTAGQRETVAVTAGRTMRAIEQKVVIQQASRDIAARLYEEFNDTQPTRVRGTAWAAFQAVVESEDYRSGRGGRKAMAESALFGERARVKEVAFGKALELAYERAN